MDASIRFTPSAVRKMGRNVDVLEFTASLRKWVAANPINGVDQVPYQAAGRNGTTVDYLVCHICGVIIVS